MNVLLIHAGGKLKSLALLKLAQYHRDLGHNVGWNIPDPDIVYISVIFDKDKPNAISKKVFYPNSEIFYGGPGYDPRVSLDPEIEKLKPLWDLVPEIENSYGYITRGCVRKCYFCKVPEMGKPHLVSYPWNWYEKGICKVMDDNINLFPLVLEKSAEWFNDNNITVDFDNFDARLIDEKQARIINSMKHSHRVRIAFDITENEKSVKRGFDNLVKAGRSAGRITIYIYCHSMKYTDRLDASYRFEKARSWGADVYLMLNCEAHPSKKARIMRRKGIAPPIWRTTSIEEIFRLDYKGDLE